MYVKKLLPDQRGRRRFGLWVPGFARFPETHISRIPDSVKSLAVAAELAAHRPDMVARLVLMNSLGLWLEDNPISDFFVLTAEERAKILWFDPECEAAKAAFAQPSDPEEKMEADLSRTETLAAVGKFIWPIPDRGLTKRIHRINMPTLLLWGDSDGMVPVKYGEAFRRFLPDSSLMVIEQCGHSPQDERPVDVAEAVLGFLRS